MTDTQLVKQLLEHRDLILGFIYALTRQYDVAEEIFQEVSLAIVEEAARGTIVVQFMPWARAIARRRIAEHYRKATRQKAMEPLSEALSDVISEAFAESEAALEREQTRMKLLLDCLQKLSGRSREVIEAFYQRRQSLKQIAAAIGWTDNSVKVALARARKVLSDCVQLKMQAGELP